MELDKELFSVTIYLLTPKLLIGNPIFLNYHWRFSYFKIPSNNP